MADLNRFVLGTAQLGMNYGINNSTGQPTIESARNILNLASSSKIFALDTADAYGNSCEVLSAIGVNSFRVQSKFIQNGQNFINCLEQSLLRLNVDSLWSYSFHRLQDLENFQDWGMVDQAKKTGKIKFLGASAYSNADIEKLSKNPQIDLIQIPFNLLDNWKIRGQQIVAAKKRGKVIHARSIYLQGLLLIEPKNIDVQFQALKKSLLFLNHLSADLKLSMQEICLRYVLSKQEIDALVVGLETFDQLAGNIEIFKKGALQDEIVEKIDSSIDLTNEKLLNPSNWIKND